MIRPAGVREAEDDRRGLLPRGYLAAQSSSIVIWWTMLAALPVTAGPYAIVRNPMCLSGLTQGLAVAMLIASPLTASYVVLGGIVWHVVVRPAVEADLRERFGKAYDTYRGRVR